MEIRTLEQRGYKMKYHTLSPSELETYNIGYMVGNRKMVITDVEWESEQEHRIYRKGYMAGLMDYKRNVSNVSNVHSQDNVSNVDFQTPITSTTPTTPIGNSISISNSNGNKDKELVSELEKEELAKTKKTKKKIEPTDYGAYEYLRPQIERWLDYKKSRGESYKSTQSVMVCAKKIHELSGGNLSIAEKIIDQSIGNNWAGIFALKQQAQKAKSISSPDYVGEGSFLRRAEDDPFCADL